MDRQAHFVSSYDSLMLGGRAGDIYAGTDFFNVGYWHPDTRSQHEACENLVEQILLSVPENCARILDAGCGCGATTRFVKNRRPSSEVIGINISQRQLEKCLTVAPGCAFELMDAARLTFRDNFFDCVISVEAAFHFQTREAFLREAWRVLKGGGRLALSDILFTSTAWVGEWMVPPENELHTLEAYRSLLTGIGFEEVQLSDVTEACWRAFCLRSMATMREQFAAGVIEAGGFEARMRYLEGLLGSSLGHYVIVSARRPA